MSSTKIALELRFLRLKTEWVRRKERIIDENGSSEGFYYAPEVDGYATPESLEDPRRLRDEFLRMPHTEEAALRFLNRVGVWKAIPGETPQTNLPKTLISGHFGCRTLVGLACPLTLEELWAEQETWKDLLKGPKKLRDMRLKARYAPPPGEDARVSDQIVFAYNTKAWNTLPMHLEWKRNPHAVLQPLTGQEMLIATTWVDLVSDSPFQECKRCGTPFTSDRKRKFCPPYELTGVSSCAHAEAQEMYKAREDAKKRTAKRLENRQKYLR